MKAKKITGWWNGEPIWREETAEETLAKEKGKDAPILARLYKAVIDDAVTKMK